MPDETKKKSVNEIVDEKPSLETPRKVNRVSTVALIVFPLTLLTIALLILIYYLVFDR